MGNIIALSKLVQSTLNDNIVDPFPAGNTRRGPHFFIESDEINLTRRDTFPKGYVRPAPPISNNVKGNIGRTGWIKKYATLDIFYYAKEDGSYKDGDGIIYKNQDLCSYMLNQIETILLNNRFAGYYLSENAFGTQVQPRIASQGSFKLYYGVIPVTFYWSEKYGN